MASTPVSFRPCPVLYGCHATPWNTERGRPGHVADKVQEFAPGADIAACSRPLEDILFRLPVGARARTSIILKERKLAEITAP